jgi:hypothetical protein
LKRGCRTKSAGPYAACDKAFATRWAARSLRRLD